MTDWDVDAASLKFAVGKSIRYHAKRQAWFDVLHRCGVVVTLVAGSGAFVAVIQDYPVLAQVASLTVAMVSALDLAVGFGSKARLYDELCRRWADLGSAMERTVDLNQQMVHEWKAERLQIEKDEPTQLAALNIICHNEEVQAYAWGTKHHVRFYQRLFCQLCTLPPHEFKPELPAGAHSGEPAHQEQQI